MHVDVGFLKSERMRSDAPPNVSFIKAIKLNSTPPKMDNWKQHQWDNYTKKQTKKTRDTYTISDAPRHVHQLRPTSFLKKHTHKWLEIDYIWCTPPCSSTGPHKFKRKTHTHTNDWRLITSDGPNLTLVCANRWVSHPIFDLLSTLWGHLCW